MTPLASDGIGKSEFLNASNLNPLPCAMDKLWPLIPDPFHILDQHVKRRIILRDFCFIILRTQARKQFMTDDPTEAEKCESDGSRSIAWRKSSCWTNLIGSVCEPDCGP